MLSIAHVCWWDCTVLLATHALTLSACGMSDWNTVLHRVAFTVWDDRNYAETWNFMGMEEMSLDSRKGWEKISYEYCGNIALVHHLWYGHVLRKEENDCLKKCMEYEVEGSRPTGSPKRTWLEVVRKDCQARKLSGDAAMIRGRWRKLIRDGWWAGKVWVGECFFWYRLKVP